MMIPCLWWLLMALSHYTLWWSPWSSWCTWWLLDPLMMVMVEPWWRWPCLAHLMEMTCIDVMVAWWVSALLRMTWFVDGDDMMVWHTWWRWHDGMTYMMESWFCLWWGYPQPHSPFQSPHLPCTSPIYPCLPLQNPHTNPNSYFKHFLIHYSTPTPCKTFTS